MRDDIKCGLFVGFVLAMIAAGVTTLWQVAAIMFVVGFLIGLMVAHDESDDYNSLPDYKSVRVPTTVPNYVEDFRI